MNKGGFGPRRLSAGSLSCLPLRLRPYTPSGVPLTHSCPLPWLQSPSPFNKISLLCALSLRDARLRQPSWNTNTGDRAERMTHGQTAVRAPTQVTGPTECRGSWLCHSTFSLTYVTFLVLNSPSTFPWRLICIFIFWLILSDWIFDRCRIKLATDT